MSGRRIYLNTRHKISRLLNPALCLCCEIPVKTDAFICPHCIKALARVPTPCRCCGLPHTSDSELCATCLINPQRWHTMAAPILYSG